MLQSLHAPEFRHWLDLAEGKAHTQRQEAAQELLAEHHMMTCVLVGLEHEADRLVTETELRPEFWRDVIDFIGNFVHQCHRAKEELHFFPTLQKRGLIEPSFSKAIEREHANAKDLTLSICEGYQDGDWEKVMRIVSLYAYLLRPHMEREERSLTARQLQTLDRDTLEGLVEALHEAEAKALIGRGRMHYVEVARRICVGLPIAAQLTG